MVLMRFLQHDDPHIQTLPKKDNFAELVLSSYLEVNAQKSREDALAFYALFEDRYKRSLKATVDFASTYPYRLQRSLWVHHYFPDIGGCSKICHKFIVEDRLTGDNVTRSVRGESSTMKWPRL